VSAGVASTLHRLLLLVGLSLLAGLLAAGLALPLVGGLGLAARNAANSFNSLPTDLVSPPLQQHSVVLAADGSVVAVLRGPEDRIPVPITAIPVPMQQAIVAIEDSRFYQNHGIDVRGILRAALHDTSGAGLQGGSTITQQYVKNVLEQQQGSAATRDTVSRKLQEARYAVALERRLPKAQILDDYLNIAYFGESAYGLGSAAEHYFSIPTDRLNLPESALLAGIVEDPSRYDPVVNPSQSRERRNTVLARMAQLGFITPAVAAAAEATPVTLRVQVSHTDACEGSTAPYFCRYVLNELLTDPALGTPAQRYERVFEGGLTIHTTLQPVDEAAAQSATDAVVPVSSAAAAPIVMVQPGTGAVLAMTQNRVYGARGAGATEVVYAEEQGQRLQFAQPGSSFKLFTLITALQQGIPPSTAFFSPACLVVKNPPPGFGNQPGSASCPGGYQNADPAEAGVYTMTNATWYSVNTYFIQLEEKVGVANIKATAESLGVPASTVAAVGGALTVGGLSEGVAPLVMAEAYATVAAQGVYCPPQTITSITAPGAGQVAFTHPAACAQVVNRNVANTITSIMQGVIDQPGGTAYATANIGRPAAGKTGTNTNYAGAWFVGFTPQLATAVALAYPSDSQAPLGGLCVPSGCYAQVFGGGLPATIWARAMRAALANVPPSNFPAPTAMATPTPTSLPSTAPASIAAGGVPPVVGEPVSVATAALTAAGYQTSIVGAIPSASVPTGDVVDESPAAGSSLPRGGSVDLLLSSGPGGAPTGSPTPAPQPSPTHHGKKH
jgi:membrane peptidoglycan carboxypeptidase